MIKLTELLLEGVLLYNGICIFSYMIHDKCKLPVKYY